VPHELEVYRTLLGLLDQAENNSTLERSEALLALCNFEIRPYLSLGLDPEVLVQIRQILAFFQKRKDLDISVDPEQVALGAFMESEDQCLLTNIRLRSSLPKWDVGSVIHLAQRKIASILGDIPRFETLDFQFGPGANTSVKSAEANIRVKLSAEWSCSNSMVNNPVLFEDLINQFPDWAAFHAEQHGGITVSPGRLEFVPKNAKTHRAIIVEPSLNTLYQGAYGRAIRDRLLKSGLDLRTQENNQYSAFKGSTDPSWATVDLSAASDTIAYATVLDLLPFPWVDVLSLGRSERVAYRGTVYDLQKFSSMGNGYTFELETLIFWGLSLAVCEHLNISSRGVLAYGDDIVIPSACIPLLKEVFNWYGFKLNADKSYYDETPFRESCGTDYYMGIDIRPFYQKDRWSIRTLFLAHNFFVRNLDFGLSRWILRQIPVHLQIYGPDGYGDGHLLGDYSLQRSRKLVRGGWEGGTFDTYRLTPLRYEKLTPGDWIYPSYSIYAPVYTDEAETLISSDWRAPAVISDNQNAWDSIRGVGGYTKISIYTLRRAIFYPF